MKIAWFVAALDLVGGPGSHYSLHLMAVELSRRGHDVTVVTFLKGKTRVPANVPYTVITTPHAESGRFGRTALGMVKTLRAYEDRADIYILNEPVRSYGVALYRLLGGAVPVVQYARTELLVGRSRSWLKAWIIGALMRSSISGFMAVSPYVAGLCRQWGVGESRVGVVPPSLDLDPLEAPIGVRAIAGARPNGRFEILCITRLIEGKGVDVLLRAASTLTFSFQLTIIGDGPERERLEALAHRLGVADKVSFRGWLRHDELIQASVYSEADLFVHPSNSEGFGRSVLEAMAHGLAVVVSDAGGQPWLVGKGGVTFQAGDHLALAARITSLRGDACARTDIARNARQRALQFTSNATAGAFEHMCERFIARPRDTPAGDVPEHPFVYD